MLRGLQYLSSTDLAGLYFGLNPTFRCLLVVAFVPAAVVNQNHRHSGRFRCTQWLRPRWFRAFFLCLDFCKRAHSLPLLSLYPLKYWYINPINPIYIQLWNSNCVDVLKTFGCHLPP